MHIYIYICPIHIWHRNADAYRAPRHWVPIEPSYRRLWTVQCRRWEPNLGPLEPSLQPSISLPLLFLFPHPLLFSPHSLPSFMYVYICTWNKNIHQYLLKYIKKLRYHTTWENMEFTWIVPQFLNKVDSTSVHFPFQWPDFILLCVWRLLHGIHIPHFLYPSIHLLTQDLALTSSAEVIRGL